MRGEPTLGFLAFVESNNGFHWSSSGKLIYPPFGTETLIIRNMTIRLGENIVDELFADDLDRIVVPAEHRGEPISYRTGLSDGFEGYDKLTTEEELDEPDETGKASCRAYLAGYKRGTAQRGSNRRLPLAHLRHGRRGGRRRLD